MNDVTRLLSQIDSGDAAASEQLLPLVYDELRRLAAHKLACENPGQTLQATALVHEAYVRLVDGHQAQTWDSRGHFFASAAEAMRRILVDQARRKHSQKRGGQQVRVNIEELGNLASTEPESPADLLALDEALKLLELEDELKSRLVKLRFFAGLSVDESAQILGISPATAKRYWIYARSWLYGKLQDNDR